MSLQFLGVSEEQVSYEMARVIVLPVPFEASVCFGKGTALGPHAILDASSQIELYDTVLKKSYPETGIFTMPPIPDHLDYAQMASQVTHETRAILSSGRMPIILGGEHSVAVPAVCAFSEIYPAATVIHIDAHADLRSSYQDRTWSHACALRRIREFNLRTVSIGIRSMSEDEAIVVRDESIFQTTIETEDFWAVLGAEFASLNGPAWLTFDVDGFDPSVIPATGTPEPGGLSWFDVMRIFKMMRSSKLTLIGADFVELSPIQGLHHPDFTIAKLIHRFVLMFA